MWNQYLVEIDIKLQLKDKTRTLNNFSVGDDMTVPMREIWADYSVGSSMSVFISLGCPSKSRKGVIWSVAP